MVFFVLLRLLARDNSSYLSNLRSLVRLGLDGDAILCMQSSGGVCSFSALSHPGPYFSPHLLISSCFDGS
jgi:hypothetical protein